MREVDLSNALFLVRALRRTQRLMDVEHYLEEYDLAPSDSGVVQAGLKATSGRPEGLHYSSVLRGSG